MKTIDTLVDDIYSVLEDDNILVSKEEAEGFGKDLSAIISERVNASQKTGVLRLSSIGKPCARQVWYEVNSPEKAEPLPPEARLKFLFGDILECLLLFLAKKSGHEVRGQQDEIVVEDVPGHRDAVIDGELVDVKSASKYSFNKFKEGLKEEDDGFGYLQQLENYHAGSDDIKKGIGHFLVVGKELGNICLDTHPLGNKDTRGYIRKRKEIAASSTPPPREFTDEEDGKSGNRKLKFNCAYCAHKWHCWPGLRGFAYSNGPRYLTRVAREPKDVPEFREKETV